MSRISRAHSPLNMGRVVQYWIKISGTIDNRNRYDPCMSHRVQSIVRMKSSIAQDIAARFRLLYVVVETRLKTLTRIMKDQGQ